MIFFVVIVFIFDMIKETPLQLSDVINSCDGKANKRCFPKSGF